MIHIKILKANKKGISTVIAAAMLVAMTVIAAVALGATVLQAPTVVTKNPQLKMTGSASLSSGLITLKHVGGDPINTGAITFKTYIPSGSNLGMETTVPNPIPGYNEAANTVTWTAPNPQPKLPTAQTAMYLSTDTSEIISDANSPGVSYKRTYSFSNLDDKTGLYTGPVQTGSVLLLKMSYCFPVDNVPKVGEQFIVEVFSGTQIITSITISMNA